MAILGLEEQAFLVLRRHLIRTLILKGQTWEEAEDACQEAVCRILEQYGNAGVRYPRRLLFLVAFHYVIDLARARPRFTIVSLEQTMEEVKDDQGWLRLTPWPFDDGGVAAAEDAMWVKAMWPVVRARYSRPVLRALLLHFEYGSYVLSRRLGVTMGHERAMVSRLLNGRSGQQAFIRRTEAIL